MANDEHLKILRQGVGVWNEWRKKNGIVADLRGTDFNGTDLSGARLYFTDLRGANLRGANLTGVCLAKSDLRGNDLSGFFFHGVDFEGADLREANLQGANLNRANLSYANLSGVDLSGAKLSFTKLNGILSGANLRSVDLRGAFLYEADLSEADLSEADLQCAYLHGVSLANSNLRETNFSLSELKKADLGGADLSGAFLVGTSLEGANLSNANLSGALLDRASFGDANLSGANFLEVELSNTFFGASNLNYVKNLETCIHRGPSSLDQRTLIKSGKLSEVFLRGCGLSDEFIAQIPFLFWEKQAFEFYSCFISYSSKDEAFAKRLHADLQDNGVRCWFAPEDLKIGDKFRSVIDQSIRVYDKLLLIFSENSLNSSWVENEVESAFEKEEQTKGTVLFPIRLDEAVMDTGAAWAKTIKRTRHIGDFSRWKEHDAYQLAFQRLLRDLKGNTGE